MILSETPKSFVTTIRVDLTEIAKIAMFLDEQNYQITNKSKSKLAATGIHLIAAYLSKYKIETTEEAIGILRTLGYGESLMKGRRDFKPLIKQMSKENLYLNTVESQPSIVNRQIPVSPDALSVQAKMHEISTNQERISSTPNIPKDYTKIDGFPLAEEAEAEPEPESPQLKIRTAADEQADISKLKTDMSSPKNLPLVEE